MEIQPSFIAQDDPLPLPAGSVPVQGAAYIPALGAPANPVPADEASLARGKTQYEINCLICHGARGKGNGPFAVFLQPNQTRQPAGRAPADPFGRRDLHDHHQRRPGRDAPAAARTCPRLKCAGTWSITCAACSAPGSK